MITLDEAKKIAVRERTADGYPSVYIHRCTELTDSWLFSFADEDKFCIFDCLLRVFKKDGSYEDYDGFDDKNHEEIEEKRIQSFVVTEGCHI